MTKRYETFGVPGNIQEFIEREKENGVNEIVMGIDAYPDSPEAKHYPDVSYEFPESMNEHDYGSVIFVFAQGPPGVQNLTFKERKFGGIKYPKLVLDKEYGRVTYVEMFQKVKTPFPELDTEDFVDADEKASEWVKIARENGLDVQAIICPHVGIRAPM